MKSNVTTQLNHFITQLLADEMLDAYDSPATRQIIKDSFTSILAEICGDVEDVSASLREYIEGSLTPNIDKVRGSRNSLCREQLNKNYPPFHPRS